MMTPIRWPASNEPIGAYGRERFLFVCMFFICRHKQQQNAALLLIEAYFAG